MHTTNTFVIQGTASSTHLPVSFSAFEDGDTHCVIEDVNQLSIAPVLIVHSLYPNQNEQLVRLLLLIDLLHDLGITNVSVFCPYLPYSRQDKRHVPGEALAAFSICRMLARAGCERLYVVDCHFMRGKERGTYGELLLINVPATELLIDICKEAYSLNDRYHVIGPDEGAKLLSSAAIDGQMHKRRGDYKQDGTRNREVTELTADHLMLSHEVIIIADDMVSTGGTMIKAIAAMREHNAQKIYCVCTHGLFLKDSFQDIGGLTDGIVFGDTIQHPHAQLIADKLLYDAVIPAWSTELKH